MNPSDIVGFGEKMGGHNAEDDENLIDGGGCSRVGRGRKFGGMPGCG